MPGPDDVLDGSDSSPPLAEFTEARFVAFHEETFRTVWALARRICGDESEAQDVCQNAYVVVYRYWHGGRLNEPPRRLLFRVIQRAAVDVIRARARRQRLERALPTSSGSGPWLGAEIRDAFARMKADDAALLLLQAEVGLSYEELAAVVKQSVPAVRSRLYRARRELSQQLELERKR